MGRASDFAKDLKKNWDQLGGCHKPLGGTHIHAMHAGGRFGTSVARLGGQACQGQLFRSSNPIDTDWWI